MALLDDICRFLNLPRHAVKVAGILFKAGDAKAHPFRVHQLGKPEYKSERGEDLLGAAHVPGRVGGRRRVMTEEVVERCRRMLSTGATRQQVADVIGVDVKTIYKYLQAT